jgi:hypothetical protein
MSVDQIRAALDSIDASPRDGFLGELEDQLVAAWTDAVNGTDYLAALTTRSRPVTLIDTEPTPTPTERRRRWPIIALAAAAAAVAIVVGGLMLAARDDTEPPVPADTTVAPVPSTATPAEEVVRGFIDAYVANDAELALSYLPDDIVAAKWESAEEFRALAAWAEASGFKMIATGCDQQGDGGEVGITLRCNFDVHGFGSEAIGLGPYRGDYWDITVRDGKIVALEQAGGDPGFSDEVWGPFANWIRTEHPDDVLVMYDDSGQDNSRNTPESLRLWEQRTSDYVQFVLAARESYPAEVAAICANQAERLGELALPVEGALDQLATWNTAVADALKQARGDLMALDKPPATNTNAYSSFYGHLIRLVRNHEASAEAAGAGDSARLAELDAEYGDIRRDITTVPAGLEQCLESLPD